MIESAELVLDGGAPIWEQIEGQIRRFILNGTLQPGEELPTVRAMAVGLAINPRAVERAYNRLEQTGLLCWGDRCGPYVSSAPSDLGAGELKQHCEAFLGWAAERGHSFAAVLQTLLARFIKEHSS